MKQGNVSEIHLQTNAIELLGDLPCSLAGQACKHTTKQFAGLQVCIDGLLHNVYLQKVVYVMASFASAKLMCRCRYVTATLKVTTM